MIHLVIVAIEKVSGKRYPVELATIEITEEMCTECIQERLAELSKMVQEEHDIQYDFDLWEVGLWDSETKDGIVHDRPHHLCEVTKHYHTPKNESGERGTESFRSSRLN